MKKLVLCVFTLSCVLVVLSLNPNWVSAKNYYIRSAEITATIKKNGIVSIEETRVFEFDGSFSWAEFTIDKKGYDRLSNLSVWEGDLAYSLNDSKEAGTWRLRERKNRFEVRLFYTAKDEQRVFTVRYDLEKALVKDQEWTEFYWTFLGTQWDKKNENVAIRLEFEEPITNFFWVDDTDVPYRDTKELNGWFVQATPKFKRDPIRVRTHFSSSYLDNAAITAKGSISPEKTDESYRLKQEKKEARERKRQELATFAHWGHSMLIFGSVFLFWTLYKRHKPEYDPNYTLPENLNVHPALVNYLVNYKTITHGAFKSALMKLIVDGYFTLKYEGREKRTFTGDRPLIRLVPTEKTITSLTHDFEKEVYAFILERSEKYEYLDDIFKKDASKVSKWYMDWTSKSLKNSIKAQNWFVRESKTDMYLHIGLQLVLAILCGVTAYFIEAFAMLGFLVIGLALIFSFTIHHRNQLGEALFNKMTKAKKMITGIRKRRYPVPQQADWNLFLLALALDNSKEDLKFLLNSWNVTTMPNVVIEAALDQASVLFIMDDFLTMTHGAYFGGAGGVGGASGASAGAAGGGGGGGAG